MKVRRDGRGKIVIPDGYRKLTKEDIIKKGDLFADFDWEKTSVITPTKHSNARAFNNLTYIRKIKFDSNN